jgi:hypothetical protein
MEQFFRDVNDVKKVDLSLIILIWKPVNFVFSMAGGCYN